MRKTVFLTDGGSGLSLQQGQTFLHNSLNLSIIGIQSKS